MGGLMNRVGSYLRRRAGEPAVMIFFGGIFLLSQASIAVVLEPVGFVHALRMQTTLDPGTFRSLVEDMFARGAANAYVAHYYYDFLHPLWYSTALALGLGWLMNRNGMSAAHDGWLLLPYLAGLGDEIENSLHLYMVLDTANIAAPLVLVANGASIMKWAVVALCLAAMAGLGLRRLLTPHK